MSCEYSGTNKKNYQLLPCTNKHHQGFKINNLLYVKKCKTKHKSQHVHHDSQYNVDYHSLYIWP